MQEEKIVIDGNRVTVQEIDRIACNKASVVLSEDETWKVRIAKGPESIKNRIDSGNSLYGVTTGFGDSVDRSVSPEMAEKLQYNLFRFHGCGTGDFFNQQEVRASMAARLVSFSKGYSAVRMDILSILCDFLNMNIIPRMPKEGSVGASGDLTPLSYLAAAVFGERRVYYKGRIVDTMDALQDCGITPLTPLPKETLALMNGTCVMTGLASLAYTRAQNLSKLSSLITALTSEAMLANRGHFDKRIFTAKPHPGQAICAQRIRDLTGTMEREKTRLQSPYSIRCAPHVTGVLEDSLPWIKEYTENEINSANDNPLIDPETGDFLHCGNFYGGHIGFAMDSLKNAVASVADLLDRQLALLVDPKTNRGLPANLSGAKGKEAAINHGFKAVQIGVSSWTAEALKNTMPAGSFSRSTECHNQDKVSMGTIAARDALRILELTEQCAAALLYASSQAFLLRMESGAISGDELPETLPEMAQAIINKYGRLVEDRELDTTINSLVEDIRTQVWDYKG